MPVTAELSGTGTLMGPAWAREVLKCVSAPWRALRPSWMLPGPAAFMLMVPCGVLLVSTADTLKGSSPAAVGGASTLLSSKS